MIDDHSATSNRDAPLENIAAELTSAAYAVALRHGVENRWLNLELELWGSLKEAVKKLGDEQIRNLGPERISNEHAHSRILPGS